MKYFHLQKDLNRDVNDGKNADRSALFTFILALLVYVLISKIWSVLLQFFADNVASRKIPETSEENIGDSSISYITRDKETPSLVMNPRRLHYVYAQVLPQAYLTLLSVLQGIVFGILLLKIPFPGSLSFGAISSLLLKQYLYLPYIVSSLVILIIWNQFVHGILFLAWPFNVFQSSLFFLMAVAETIVVIGIGTLSLWLFGLGCIAIVGGILRFNNIRYLPDKEQSSVAPLNVYSAFSKKTEIFDGTFYTLVGFIVLFLSFLCNDLTEVIASHSSLSPTFFSWFCFILLFSIECVILQIDKKNRRIYLATFAKGSDLLFSRHGILGYRTEGKKDKSKF